MRLLPLWTRAGIRAYSPSSSCQIFTFLNPGTLSLPVPDTWEAPVREHQLFLEITPIVKTGGDKSQQQAPVCSYGLQCTLVGFSSRLVVLSSPADLSPDTRHKPYINFLPIINVFLFHIPLSDSASLMEGTFNRYKCLPACLSFQPDSQVLSLSPLPTAYSHYIDIYMLFFLPGLHSYLFLAFA